MYNDPHFRQQLRDAAASLAVGSAWDPKTKVNPLIRTPNLALHRGLTQLEEGEEWLLEPQPDAHNPQLWSPGIKLGVTPSSFTFQQELFGPVLGLVRADTVEHALTLMNQTAYGLTAGIHSLDEREQSAWLTHIEAGNCYINRTMTGAVVERQPFGGCKESSFGKGAKAGGPNYLVQFMQARQIALPTEQNIPKQQLHILSQALERNPPFAGDLALWKASVGSYTFYWEEYFSHAHDPSLVLGQDNLQCYVPHPHVVLRGQQRDSLLDLLRIIAAALTCRTSLEVSVEEQFVVDQFRSLALPPFVSVRQETHEAFAQRIQHDQIRRVRLLQPPPAHVQQALAGSACHLNVGAVMANGRLELLHLLREVSISRDYHRYGNLGSREKEKRHPLPQPSDRKGTC